jgi:hypothetical protein
MTNVVHQDHHHCALTCWQRWMKSWILGLLDAYRCVLLFVTVSFYRKAAWRRKECGWEGERYIKIYTKLNGTNCGDIHVKRDTSFKYCNIVLYEKIQDFDFNPFYLYGTAGHCSPVPPIFGFWPTFWCEDKCVLLFLFSDFNIIILFFFNCYV